MRFLRSLALLPNYCHPPCLISAPNNAPVAADSAAGRRACAARPRGKAGSERRKACFHPGGSGFHLPRGRGGRWPGPLPVLFNRLSRHSAAFFGTFLGSKKVPSPPSSPRPLRPPPPHEKAPSPSAGGGAIFKQKSSFIQPARRCPGFPGAHCSADRPKPRRSTARCSSHRPGAGRHS